jgi:hypothetical protein
VSLPIEERLWSRAVKQPNGCWEFSGNRHVQGYGVIRHEGRSRRAHRVAYELAHGPIPERMVVMHSCDNPPCINPEHLSVGTVAENNRDRQNKGRSAPPVNWAGWQRRLTQCKYGHPFTPENTYIKPESSHGVRVCRTCNREGRPDRYTQVTCEACGRSVLKRNLSRHQQRWHR